MAAPGCHVGAAARRGAAAEGAAGGEAERDADAEAEEEEEAEAEGEEPGTGALRSVFPRDPELFGDSFPVERRYRLCGRVLRIAQHHGPRLGLAASVWEAALSLCRYIEEQRLDFRGRRVIELGAGTGIVGILAAALGGDVTITDQPAALEQIRENVRLNFAAWAGPRVRALVWGRDEGSFPTDFDVVLGSDIVYHPPAFPPLLRTLRRLCGPRAVALLCAKIRGGGGGGGDAGGGSTRRFFRQMLPAYFQVQLLRREPEEEIEIYRVTRGAGGGPVGDAGGWGDPIGDTECWGGTTEDGGDPIEDAGGRGGPIEGGGYPIEDRGGQRGPTEGRGDPIEDVGVWGGSIGDRGGRGGPTEDRGDPIENAGGGGAPIEGVGGVPDLAVPELGVT